MKFPSFQATGGKPLRKPPYTLTPKRWEKEEEESPGRSSPLLSPKRKERKEEEQRTKEVDPWATLRDTTLHEDLGITPPQEGEHLEQKLTLSSSSMRRLQKPHGDPEAFARLVAASKTTPPPNPKIKTAKDIPEPRLQTLYNWLQDVVPSYLGHVNNLRPRDFLPEQFQLLEYPVENENWCFCEEELLEPNTHTDVCFTMQAAIALVREAFPGFRERKPRVTTKDHVLKYWVWAILDWIDQALEVREVPTVDWRQDNMGKSMAPPQYPKRREFLHPGGIYRVLDEYKTEVYLIENPKSCTVRSHQIDPNIELNSQPGGEIFEYCRVKEHRWRPDWAPFYPQSTNIFSEYIPLEASFDVELNNGRIPFAFYNARKEGRFSSGPEMIPQRVPYREKDRKQLLRYLEEQSEEGKAESSDIEMGTPELEVFEEGTGTKEQTPRSPDLFCSEETAEDEPWATQYRGDQGSTEAQQGSSEPHTEKPVEEVADVIPLDGFCEKDVLTRPNGLPEGLYQVAMSTLAIAINTDRIEDLCRKQILNIYEYCRTEMTDEARRDFLAEEIANPGICTLCLGDHNGSDCPTTDYSLPEYMQFVQFLWKAGIPPASTLEVHYQTRNINTGRRCRASLQHSPCEAGLVKEHRRSTFMVIDGGCLQQTMSDWILFKPSRGLERYHTDMELYYQPHNVHGTPRKHLAVIHETVEYWKAMESMRNTMQQPLFSLQQMMGFSKEKYPHLFKDRRIIIRNIERQLQIIHDLVKDEDLSHLAVKEQLQSLMNLNQEVKVSSKEHLPLPHRATQQIEVVYQTFTTDGKSYASQGSGLFRRLKFPVLDFGLLETVLKHPDLWNLEVTQNPFDRDDVYYSRLAEAGWNDVGQRRLVCFRNREIPPLLKAEPKDQIPAQPGQMMIPTQEQWTRAILDQLCYIQRYHSKVYPNLQEKDFLLEDVLMPEICSLCGTFWMGYGPHRHHRCKPNPITLKPGVPLVRKIWVEEHTGETLSITQQRKATSSYYVLDGGHFVDAYNNNWGDYELLKITAPGTTTGYEAMRMIEKNWFQVISPAKDVPPFTAFKYPRGEDTFAEEATSESNTEWMLRQHRLKLLKPSQETQETLAHTVIPWNQRAEMMMTRDQPDLDEDTTRKELCCFLIMEAKPELGLTPEQSTLGVMNPTREDLIDATTTVNSALRKIEEDERKMDYLETQQEKPKVTPENPTMPKLKEPEENPWEKIKVQPIKVLEDVPAASVYFSEPDKVGKPEQLPHYLQAEDLEALMYVWSRASNQAIIQKFPEGLFPFPPDKYRFQSQKSILVKCQFCEETHITVTKSCIMDQFLTWERQRMPLAIQLAPAEIKLKILKDRFMRYHMSGYTLDRPGAVRKRDPDYPKVDKSLWEKTPPNKRPWVYIDFLIDEAYEVEPGFAKKRREAVIYWKNQLETYKRNSKTRKPKPWYKRKSSGKGKPYKAPPPRR